MKLTHVRHEALVWLRHPMVKLLAAAAVLCGATVGLFPIVILGRDGTLAWHAALPGGLLGSLLAVILGPAVAATMAQSDFVGGMRVTRQLAGHDARHVDLLHLIVSLLSVLLTTFAVTTAALLTGVADWGLRFALGLPTQIVNAPSGTITVVFVGLSAAGAATAACWLTCLVLRSGANAGYASVLLALSWFGLLASVNNREVRGALVLHPLALPWRLVDPIDAPSTEVEAPWLVAVLAALMWASVLATAVAKRWGKP